MSIKLMNLVWDLEMPCAEKMVLMSLADNASQDKGECFVLVSTICRRSSLDDRTVQRMLKRLEENGHITRYMRPGRSTLFRVHPRQNVTTENSDPRQNVTTKTGGVPPSECHPPEQSAPRQGDTNPRQGDTNPRHGAAHNHLLTVSEPQNSPPSPPAGAGGKVSKKIRVPRPESDGFKELKAIYPKRAGSQRYDDASKFYEQRLAEGDTHDVIKAGMIRYAKLMEYERKIGTATVMQMATFLGPNRAYLEPYDMPVEAPKETPKERSIRERREALFEVHKRGIAAGVDFRVAFNHESIDDYRQALQTAIEQKRRIESGEIKPRSLHDVTGALQQMPKHTEK